MRWLLGLALFLSGLALIPTKANACSIIPFRFDPNITAHEPFGLVRGKVISTKDFGRTATFSVSAYTAKGKVPQEITLGPTIKVGLVTPPNAYHSCQGIDPSLIFYEGQEWLLFVTVDKAGIQLFDPRGTSGLLVDDHGQVRLDQTSHDRTPVSDVLNSFAAANQPKVRHPGDSWLKWTWIPLAAATCWVLLRLPRRTGPDA